VVGGVGGAFVIASVVMVGAGYFHPLISRGGDAHPTFRTRRPEPKAAAYDFIRRESANDPVVRVFAEDWWLYWPVRYLALPDAGRVFVEIIGRTPPLHPAGVNPPAYPSAPTRIYAVVFAGGPAQQAIGTSGRVVFTAADPIGRPILHVVSFAPGEPLPFAPLPR
jgi:hypothetical protein